VQQKDISPMVKVHVLMEYQGKWRGAGIHLRNILEYVSLNMRALRKIVKKQHKRVRSRAAVQMPPVAAIAQQGTGAALQCGVGGPAPQVCNAPNAPSGARVPGALCGPYTAHAWMSWMPKRRSVQSGQR
jgi:hypothetical protein